MSDDRNDSELNPRGIHEEELFQGILKGEISSLGRGITLIESNSSKHHSASMNLIEKCLPYSGKSVRIGITGVPGVGKSTFIEAFGKHLTSQGKKVAVLAVDPTSQKTRGSILGDKTRMEKLSVDPMAFIRPSPSGSKLGGVARKTREAIILCEAAGYEIIIVETVGVGQSETAVHSMVDFFLLLMLAGAGDQLQGIKRGIMEMAHALVINKADGININAAKKAKEEYKSALHLFPNNENSWNTKVSICSSIESSGIEELWEMITDFQNAMIANGYFEENRKRQDQKSMMDSIEASIRNLMFDNQQLKEELERLSLEVHTNKLSPFAASEEFMGLFIQYQKQQ